MLLHLTMISRHLVPTKLGGQLRLPPASWRLSLSWLALGLFSPPLVLLEAFALPHRRLFNSKPSTGLAVIAVTSWYENVSADLYKWKQKLLLQHFLIRKLQLLHVTRSSFQGVSTVVPLEPVVTPAAAAAAASLLLTCFDLNGEMENFNASASHTNLGS